MVNFGTASLFLNSFISNDSHWRRFRKEKIVIDLFFCYLDCYVRIGK